MTSLHRLWMKVMEWFRPQHHASELRQLKVDAEYASIGSLLRIHNSIKSRLVKRYRTKEIIRAFTVAHNQELTQAPIQSWPYIKAKQAREIALIKAGQFDIVDRKSSEFPWLPQTVQRMNQPIAKLANYNLRRMSRTPVPRRAINLIKNAVTAQTWDIELMDDVDPVDNNPEERMDIAKKIFRHPNNQDSFQTWMEQCIEDFCILGAYCSELKFTQDPDRPLKMWPVNVESIRFFPLWKESTPEDPRYAQMTGLRGERGAVVFYDDELLYIKDNPATDNPFGTGKMEVGFNQIAAFLGVQDMAGRAGTDQIHKTWLWWDQPQTADNYNLVRRHIQNELEGQAKISIIGGMKKPDILELQPTTPDDLLLEWQQLLIRIIADAFDMSALSLGIEHDVNRAVGEVLSDADFRSAVVPTARKLEEAFTRKILHEKLGWIDLKFKFTNLEDPDLQTKVDILSRAYSMNGVTPNEIRRKLGEKEKENPYYNLTQLEGQIVIIEATAAAQDKNAENAANRQMDMMTKMQQQQQPQDQGDTFPEDGQQQDQGEPQQPSFGKPPSGGLGKLPAAPKPPKQIASVKAFPISGTRYNAREIAAMSIDRLAWLFTTGQLPRPKYLIRDMKAQEAGILQQLSDEVREFFEGLEEEEKSNPKKPVSKKVMDQWNIAQKKRWSKQTKRISDYTEWLYDEGNTSQQLKSFNPPDSDIGKPGKLNPRRIF